MEHAVKSDHLDSFDIDWSEFRLDEEKDLRHFPHFTPEDLQKIWTSDLPYKDYYKVCYYTDMLSGDVANLKRDDIDRKRHLI